MQITKDHAAPQTPNTATSSLPGCLAWPSRGARAVRGSRRYRLTPSLTAPTRLPAHRGETTGLEILLSPELEPPEGSRTEETESVFLKRLGKTVTRHSQHWVVSSLCVLAMWPLSGGPGEAVTPHSLSARPTGGRRGDSTSHLGPGKIWKTL